jgi:hypothetical protein
MQKTLQNYRHFGQAALFRCGHLLAVPMAIHPIKVIKLLPVWLTGLTIMSTIILPKLNCFVGRPSSTSETF